MVVGDQLSLDGFDGCALEIDVEEVFFPCAKAFMRSDTWNPEAWDPSA